MGIPNRETLDYSAFTKAISKRISPPISADEYLCKLEARQHGLSESVRAFADAVETLSIKAYGTTDKSLAGRMALAKFNKCIRLPTNIERASLFHKGFKDLDAAVSYVERWNLATSQSTRVSSHIEAAAIDQRAGRPPNSVQRCYNCRESGHLIPQCPHPASNRLKCKFCNGTGHFNKDCPRKPENFKGTGH